METPERGRKARLLARSASVTRVPGQYVTASGKRHNDPSHHLLAGRMATAGS